GADKGFILPLSNVSVRSNIWRSLSGSGKIARLHRRSKKTHRRSSANPPGRLPRRLTQRLLREWGRPSRRRAAEQRDELAAIHSITSTAGFDDFPKTTRNGALFVRPHRAA